jgi:hypothetical protein
MKKYILLLRIIRIQNKLGVSNANNDTTASGGIKAIKDRITFGA